MNEEMKEKLGAKLPRERVKSREGPRGMPRLSYISWDDAVRSANEIFGFGGWTSETVSMEVIDCRETEDGKWAVCYRALVRVTAIGAFYDGTGYGEGKDRSIGQAHESAFKEAESDACKRALRNFGDQFGLALYSKDQAHVEKQAVKPAQEPAVGAAGGIVAASPWAEWKCLLHLSEVQRRDFCQQCNTAGKKWKDVAKEIDASFKDSVASFEVMMEIAREVPK